jgi:hypothetical protein
MINEKNTFELDNIPDADKSAFDNVYVVDGGQNLGIGVSYDVISDQGVDFSSQAFGAQLTLDLISDTPHAIFLFAHNKQTIAYNSSGLQVMV